MTLSKRQKIFISVVSGIIVGGGLFFLYLLSLLAEGAYISHG